MFIPIYDHNALERIRFQYVTVILVIINIVFFLLTSSQITGYGVQQSAVSYGVTPVVLFNNAVLPAGFAHVSQETALVTYMFFHADWLHLIGNLAFLWVFGDNVEDSLGHIRFLIFYILCGICAALVHSILQPGSEAPLIGASGAVSGIIAAYLLLHPNVKVWVLVLWRLPLRLSAFWVLSFWIALQVFNVVFPTGEQAVAWWAHLGGIVAGVIFVILLKPRHIKLFN